MADKNTPTTKDPKFQKVVQTFLKTPPRQHKEDAGKKRAVSDGCRPKRKNAK